MLLRLHVRADHSSLWRRCRGGRRVRRRLALFPEGGLFLGPTHAIQVGTPIENILAMYRTAGSLATDVGHAIRDTLAEADKQEFDRFKLF